MEHNLVSMYICICLYNQRPEISQEGQMRIGIITKNYFQLHQIHLRGARLDIQFIVKWMIIEQEKQEQPVDHLDLEYTFTCFLQAQNSARVNSVEMSWIVHFYTTHWCPKGPSPCPWMRRHCVFQASPSHRHMWPISWATIIHENPSNPTDFAAQSYIWWGKRLLDSRPSSWIMITLTPWGHHQLEQCNTATPQLLHRLSSSITR